MQPTISNSQPTVKSDETEQMRIYNRAMLSQIPPDRQLGVMIKLQDAVRDVDDPFAALHRQGFLLLMAVKK